MTNTNLASNNEYGKMSDRRKPHLVTRKTAGYAVYERIGVRAYRVAWCSTLETARIVLDIILEANIRAFMEEVYE